MPRPPRAKRPAARIARKRAEADAARIPPRDISGLRARLATVPLPGTPPGLATRARKALTTYVDSAAAHGLPFAEIVARLADGRAAAMLAEVEESEARKAGRDPHAGAACAAGCAFCCVLTGDDGGTVTAHEAARLHAALAPRAGQPDGRAWHPRACPALDPETRACRAYDARPSLCRAYHSTDADACAAHLRGEAREGARLAGGHLSYLAAHGLARAALAGAAEVPTFSLFDLAAAAVDGADPEAALARARHGDGALDAERRRTARGLRAGKRPR